VVVLLFILEIGLNNVVVAMANFFNKRHKNPAIIITGTHKKTRL
jgi:hypothetical protein